MQIMQGRLRAHRLCLSVNRFIRWLFSDRRLLVLVVACARHLSTKTSSKLAPISSIVGDSRDSPKTSNTMFHSVIDADVTVLSRVQKLVLYFVSDSFIQIWSLSSSRSQSLQIRHDLFSITMSDSTFVIFCIRSLCRDTFKTESYGLITVAARPEVVTQFVNLKICSCPSFRLRIQIR